MKVLAEFICVKRESCDLVKIPKTDVRGGVIKLKFPCTSQTDFNPSSPL